MSLRPEIVEPVPELTARIARAAFPRGNVYLQMREELGTLFTDAEFVAVYPRRGRPAWTPRRLVLITVLQFVENLSDRQAAEAVRARIDWKYALSLELEDAGFDFSVLCEFRERLVEGNAEPLLLDRRLDHFKQKNLLKARGRQRTDSAHVLAAIRVMNRLELVTETLRAALNELATVAPDWLRGMAPATWYERYSLRAEQSRLPKGEKARQEYAESASERNLRSRLAACDYPGAYDRCHHPGCQLHRRHSAGLGGQSPASQPSPGRCRVCGRPIVGPEPAKAPGGTVLSATGSEGWQVQEGGYDQSQFTLDWGKQQATCPEGKTSIWWGTYRDKGSGETRVKMRFSQTDCAGCEARSKCVRSAAGRARTIGVPERAYYDALKQARGRIVSETGAKEYQQRAGVEGLLSQGVRRSGMRHCRYRGLAKTPLQHIATAAGLNVLRVVNHLNKQPLAKTRRSRFAKLQP